MTRRTARGVTLIELLVAIGLGMILIMLAVPAYNTWTADAEVSSAASSIADGLRFANAEAIKQNRAVEFSLTPGTGWTVRIPAQPGPPLVPAGPIIKEDRFAEGARRSSAVASPPGTSRVTFNSLGLIERPNPSDGSDPIDFVDIDISGVAKRPLRVLVGLANSRTGVRVCDRHFSYPSDPMGCP